MRNRCNVHISIVTDLDLLTGGFEVIEPTTELAECRQKLLELVDEIIDLEGGLSETTQGKIKKAREKTELHGRWNRAKFLWKEFQKGNANFMELESAVDEFFSWEKRNDRLKVLQKCQDRKLIEAKRKLLAKLRCHNIYVLERGELESYYPETIEGNDKPSKAQDFCKKILTREDVLALCDSYCDNEGEKPRKEFEIICDCLFRC